MFSLLNPFKLYGVLGDVAESFVDNVVRDRVTPSLGSVVYCGLLNNMVEHSGIYVSHDCIVHLDGGGRVEAITPEGFLGRLGGLNMAMTIYVSSRNGQAIGDEQVGNRASSMIGKSRSYNVALDNCHQFTAGCLTGNFENANNFLWMLKDCASEVLGSREWRAWDR
jgi:hypothetical protein